MKPRRHVIGGVLLLAVAAVLAVSEWTVFDARVLAPLAAGLFLAGLANVAVGIGRPAVVLDYRDSVEAGTALAFALLAAAIVIENALAPDGPVSYLLAVLWGAAAVFTGWLGVERLRTGRNADASDQ